jgi:hypothetical protein
VADLAGSLFHGCPLPGCPGITDDPGVPCGDCQKAFGSMLQPAGTPSPRRSAEETARLLAERDKAVRAVYAAREPGRQG